MEYIFGSGLLFAGFLMIAVGRRILSRPGASLSIDDFGVAEAISLSFTGFVVFGLTEIITALVRDWSLAGALEMSAAVGTATAASVAVWVVLGRIFPQRSAAGAGERPVDPPAPGSNRDGRPTASGAPRGGGAKTKRAA